MQAPENILALDAAGAACSCAVWRDGGIAAKSYEEMSRGQSERLVPMADDVMARAGLDYGALDAIAVTLGPGGFTGVRIGLATGRAFALALKIPVMGVTNFEAVAAGVAPEACADRSLAVVLEAKRADLYVQAFAVGNRPDGNGDLPGRLEPLSAPAALMPDELDAFLPPGPLLLAGDASEAAGAALRAAGRPVALDGGKGCADAAFVAALAALQALPGENAPAPAPLYLRAPDVTLPGGRPLWSAAGSRTL